MEKKYTAIDLAEQQLLGFHHGRHGFTIKSLVESMGLTKSEWKAIQRDHNPHYLTEDEVQEINSCFN